MKDVHPIHRDPITYESFPPPMEYNATVVFKLYL